MRPVCLPAPNSIAGVDTGKVLRPASSRLVGVDAARGVALLGMAAVHVLPGEDADGSLSLTYLVASGRSAALFAVLAGVGLVLAFRPARGPDRLRADAAIALRAALLGVVGLALGALESGVAVILVYYAALFVLVLPWLCAGRRTLLSSAAAIAVVVPVVSFAVRPGLAEADTASPTFGDLSDPGQLSTELLLTGYYPALAWTVYLLVGLAAGRSALQRPVVAAVVAAAGATAAAVAAGVSALLLGPLGGYDRLAGVVRPSPGLTVEQAVGESRFGNVPTTSPWWLATDAPHSSTPLDLLGTTGTALFVLGLALLVAHRVPVVLAPLTAAGNMPLSLYSLHVLLLGTTDTEDPTRYYLLQVAAGLLGAFVWRRYVGRGPLEAALAEVVRPVRAGRTEGPSRTEVPAARRVH